MKNLEDLFKDILDDDEKIIGVIKPSKGRYWGAELFFLAIPLFWPVLIILFVLSFFTYPFLRAKAYEKLCYAYTNKRLIRRSGLVGVQYDSLNYKVIVSDSVYVGFLDKRFNTGCLSFSRSSNPNTPLSLRFEYVPEPYKYMKAIKQQIAEAFKNKQKDAN